MRARHRLVGVHQVFALAETVQEHRHRADVETVQAEPQQVIEDASPRRTSRGCTARSGTSTRRPSRSPSRRRARCTSSRRSRAGPCTAPTGGRSCAPPASRSRGAAGRCGDRRAGSPRRRSTPGAARRAPPVLGRSSGCGANFRHVALFLVRVVRFAHMRGGDFPQVDRHRLVDDALLLGS